jgi:hypothetical protein
MHKLAQTSMLVKKNDEFYSPLHMPVKEFFFNKFKEGLLNFRGHPR